MSNETQSPEMAIETTETSTAKGTVARKPRGETHSEIKGMSIVKGTKIDLVELETAFNILRSNAFKSNEGNLAAGRRFRTESVAFEAQLLKARAVSAK